jgi:hypothetical protein
MLSRIAILTNFMDFNPGYSLSGIVVEQCHMLLREGHVVHVFVNEQYNPKHDRDSRLWHLRRQYGDQLVLHKKTKFMHLIDYRTKDAITHEHVAAAEEAGETYYKVLRDEKIDTVFTHDFIFTGWNLPYSLAVKHASEKLRLDVNVLPVSWLHWVHSVPSDGRDWWRIQEYGPNHYIVFPNRTEVVRVADMFHTRPSNVICVPHLKDIRNWYEFGDDAMHFTTIYPDIMRAEAVQIYPASTDRLSAKQLDIVIRVFGYIKQMNTKVFLVVANQWATGRQAKENIKTYIDLAFDCGLEYGMDFAFTSITPGPLSGFDNGFDILEAIEQSEGDKDIFPYSIGINRRMLRELQLLSSIFIFPTLEESFGLVGPEASYSGALVILNRSLTMQFEIMGHMAPAFDFGSHHQLHPPAKEEEYLRAVAAAVLNRLFCNESMMTRTRARARYCMDNIYDRYYKPLFLLEKYKHKVTNEK